MGSKIIDSSGNELHGELVGDANIVSDKLRGRVLALEPDGSMVCENDRAIDITGSVTLSLWLKTNASKARSWAEIIHKGGRSSFALFGLMVDSYIFFNCYGIHTDSTNFYASTSGTIDIYDGKWHNYTGTYDGYKISLYFDGELVNSCIASGNISSNSEPVQIGGMNLKGLVDDVRIYSYALSAEEVKILYEGKEPPREKRSD